MALNRNWASYFRHRRAPSPEPSPSARAVSPFPFQLSEVISALKPALSGSKPSVLAADASPRFFMSEMQRSTRKVEVLWDLPVVSGAQLIVANSWVRRTSHRGRDAVDVRVGELLVRKTLGGL